MSAGGWEGSAFGVSLLAPKSRGKCGRTALQLSVMQVKIARVRLGGKLAVSIKSFTSSPTHPSLCTTELLFFFFTVKIFAVIIGEIIIGKSSHPRSDFKLGFNHSAATCWQCDLAGVLRAVLNVVPIISKVEGEQ